jgi:hypothetical protein
VEHQLDGHDTARDLAGGVHVAVTDRGQRRQREVERVGLQITA